MGVIAIANGNQSPALDVPVDPSGAMHPGDASGADRSDPRDRSPDPSAASGHAAGPSVYDVDRLERAISALVDENARLREESLRLRRALEERSERVRALEGELLDANQRRRDVVKRVDELIAQMDALDAQLEQAEPDPSP